MIEAMVATAILSFSLLGFAQAQLLALHINEQAYLINLADLKNSELAEIFTICQSHPVCMKQALILWDKEIQECFPKGKANISSFNLPNYESKIQWFFPFSKFQSAVNLLFSV